MSGGSDSKQQGFALNQQFNEKNRYISDLLWLDIFISSLKL